MVAALLAFVPWLPLPAAAQKAAERVERVAVRVQDLYGKAIEREIVVTVWEIPGRAPHPLLVLNHGRSASADGRAKLGRARYSQASAFFAARGYSVWVPTRIGYGVSGADEDPEWTGSCSNKSYPPGYDAAADQTLQVIEYASRRPGIDATRVVVAGQSYGGTTAITVAARAPKGLVAAISFAGGGGGNPDTRTGEPCQPERLERMFAAYGRSARVPTLWVYSENDRYFGPRYPKEWFDAYRAAGGTGELLMLAPFGADGHGLFTRGFEIWRPLVERFLDAVEAKKPA